MEVEEEGDMGISFQPLAWVMKNHDTFGDFLEMGVLGMPTREKKYNICSQKMVDDHDPPHKGPLESYPPSKFSLELLNNPTPPENKLKLNLFLHPI